MKKPICLPDPKIVPPPGQSVEITLEFTKKELQPIKEVAPKCGCWSVEEFVRMARAEFLESQIPIETWLNESEPF